MSNIVTKEPLVRITKRDVIPLWERIVVRLVAVLVALIVAALFIFFITKLNPLDVYKTMWDGAFGGNSDFVKKLHRNVTIRDICTLLLLGVGLAPAFKMKFWNCGAEGQMLMGAIGTAFIMINLKDSGIPNGLLLVIMAVSAMVMGAIWGLIPAIFKAKFNTNETLFTLMMNYVAIQLTSFCVAKWENPYGSNSVGLINAMNKYGWFPENIFDNKYTLNIIIAATFTIAMFFYLRNSKQGYEISVVGASKNTARYAGMSVKRVIIRTMVISSAICGLAGFVGVAGVDHTISTNTAGGRGFTAIIVAWLAKFNTFVMVAITLLIIFLDRGASEIASKFQLNEYASEIITGIILFFILGSEFFINYKLHIRKKETIKQEEA